MKIEHNAVDSRSHESIVNRINPLNQKLLLGLTNFKIYAFKILASNFLITVSQIQKQFKGF